MNEKELGELFDLNLKNYLLLEKTIYESTVAYEKNPTEEMKKLLCDVCSYARLQINVLLELLPKICSGEMLRNYQQQLETKSDELFDIRRKVSDQPQK